ncbi:DUF1217 domain-containing protein [Roseomonas sp. OT10]|uniref:DUF1217 domain-containing protein n=1 Tax=Roseomonas cutis TaxID=2897332 RepID=UPI001E42EFFC|nr:DUF1217 domain-containing protein [Roseomonas sp. OT10]UFN48298.1 DUF1217 domain-containing protein [Roseomonas sp. OT10]
MLDGIGSALAWTIFQRQGEALQDRFEAQKDNTRDVARFREMAAKITSVEELLKDRRSLSMVLEAFQLEDEIDKKALLRKLMTQDPGAETSLANRLTDSRYRQLAAAFGGRTDAPLGKAALVDSLIDKALTNRFEKAAGDGNAGLREALYFKRQIGDVTSIAGLMGDKALTAVVKGALNLPDSFGLLDYDQQKAILTKRVDTGDFSDPKAVRKMVQRYLTAQDASSTSQSPVLSLFNGDGGTSGLMSLIGRKLSVSL